MNNIFDNMVNSFFSNLPEKGSDRFEYIESFRHSIEDDLVKFFRNSFNMNYYTTILNNPAYSQNKKKGLLSFLTAYCSFEDMLIYTHSLDEENRLFCIDTIKNSSLYYREKTCLFDFDDKADIIKIFKSFLQAASRNDYHYIIRYKDSLAEFKFMFPETLLSKEMAKWNVSDFVKPPTSYSDEYRKTMGWQLFKSYPFNIEKQKEPIAQINKDILYSLLTHIQENKDNYVKHYPYAIFVYNLLLEIDKLFNHIIPDNFQTPFQDKLILDNDTRQYTLRYLNNCLSTYSLQDLEKSNQTKLIIEMMIEKEMIKSQISTCDQPVENNNKRRL